MLRFDQKINSALLTQYAVSTAAAAPVNTVLTPCSLDHLTIRWKQVNKFKSLLVHHARHPSLSFLDRHIPVHEEVVGWHDDNEGPGSIE